MIYELLVDSFLNPIKWAASMIKYCIISCTKKMNIEIHSVTNQYPKDELLV